MLLCCTPDPNAYYGVFKKLKTSFAGGPLLGKDFECVQRIFALAGEWQAGIHVLTRIASRGGDGGGSGEAVTCDGGDSTGTVAWWHTMVEDSFLSMQAWLFPSK